MDEFVPKKKRTRTEKDNLRQRLTREKGKIGERVPEHTPLYQKCPQCGGIGPTFTEGVGYSMCVCKHGMMQTGWDAERCDKLVKQNDEMLVLLADLRQVLALNEDGQGIHAAMKLLNPALAGRDTEIEDARSRTNCD